MDIAGKYIVIVDITFGKRVVIPNPLRRAVEIPFGTDHVWPSPQFASGSKLSVLVQCRWGCNTYGFIPKKQRLKVNVK